MFSTTVKNSAALKTAVAVALAVTHSLAGAMASAEDWMQFRGPGSGGIGEATGIPATWSSTENVVWRTELPGPGGSSPIVVGERVYITSYSGYAESIDAPGNKNNLMRHVVCLDRASGNVVWSKEFKAKQPESDYTGGNNTRHGYATSTPVSDGKNLFIFFGISGVFAMDLEGNELWTADVGSGTHGWGSATSPVLHKNLLILNASVESAALIALDKATGKEVWRTEGTDRAWSSPVLVEVGGKTEVVLNLPETVVGYDADTGEVLWRCEGIPDSYVCPSVVAKDGIVYAIGGRRSEAVAIRAGGRGDVTATHLLWRTREGNNVTSPVLLDGYLYWLHESRGRAMCLNAETGAVVYDADLDPRPGLLYGSITVADGKLYAPSQTNGTYVIKAGPTFEQIANNTFADDTARTNGSIVVSNNQLIMRTDKAIYCIGN